MEVNCGVAQGCGSQPALRGGHADLMLCHNATSYTLHQLTQHDQGDGWSLPNCQASKRGDRIRPSTIGGRTCVDRVYYAQASSIAHQCLLASYNGSYNWTSKHLPTAPHGNVADLLYALDNTFVFCRMSGCCLALLVRPPRLYAMCSLLNFYIDFIP